MEHLFHIESLSPLYEAVQTSGIFPDSKYFPDCTPKSNPPAILKAFEQAKDEAGFDLKKFVEMHFDPAQTPESEYHSERKTISEHLDHLWDALLRNPSTVHRPPSTVIPLPHPYIVPGGRFREIYYWDSYFTMLGLQVSGRTDIIQNMVDNFAHLIETVGFIPNGNRTYYLGRSQPPFFALMVNVLAEIKGEATLLQYRRSLEKEYAFWMAGEHELTAENPAHRRVVRLPDGTIMNRYWDDNAAPRPEAYTEDLHIAEQSGRDPATVYRHIRAAAESGWDFSSRWFRDGQRMDTIQTAEIVPVDLNCLLYYLEKTLVHTYRQLPDHTPVEVMKDRARLRREAIQKYCWNDATDFYFDYDFIEKKHTGQWTLAAAFPLFFRIAEKEQAEEVAHHLETKFLQSGGLTTTLTRSGQQWDAPNGWAPLQWMAFQGLRNYGFDTLALEIRRRWMALNEKTYAATGKMMEKYNVMDPGAKAGGGEYPNQDGFGWTNGVYLAMRAKG
ncbi:MAG: alpha,alpha-trehalase TreF [Haliscomenobacteraceae bacterium CHB4]|nr:Periplasmic trehalase [Saprospiraceae bacterium]MCE7925162.1 alpha,alpha-trehalase TreF [Haliscomenobacteraceae bacterium CHB4]